MSHASPHEVLGVDRCATEETIRAAHRRLVRRWHPDRRPDDRDAGERIKTINGARDALLLAGRETQPCAVVGSEALAWSAQSRHERIVLTSARLIYQTASTQQEIVLANLVGVLVRHHFGARASTLIVRTTTGTLRLALPRPIALRLAERLSAQVS